MPELPEVETIRRDLESKIIGQTIRRVQVKLPRLIKSDPAHFKRVLAGNALTALQRQGKLLIATLARSNYALLIHLKMTGQLLYRQDAQVTAGGHSFVSMDWTLPNKHTYVTFEFADGSHLYFNDMRTFGYLRLATPDELARIKAGFGIEPLQPEFTLLNFRSALAKRKVSVKAALLNQSVVSGIGNIYADEICFYARVRPVRLVASLNTEEIGRLYRGAQVIIKKAIARRGTTFNNYVDAQGRQGNFLSLLKVFGRAGEPCKRCQTGTVQKIRHAGRGTHFCPSCQL